MNDRLKIVYLLACACFFATVELPLAAQTPQGDADQAADVYSDELQSGLFKRMEQLEIDQKRLTEMLEGPRDDDALADELDIDGRPLPAYVYERSYYNRSGVGARAIADYAPAEYEARDQQLGPATPEFTRIGPPDEVTDAQRDDLVVGGLYPGSFLAPGTNTSVRFRGFVRLAG